MRTTACTTRPSAGTAPSTCSATGPATPASYSGPARGQSSCASRTGETNARDIQKNFSLKNIFMQRKCLDKMSNEQNVTVFIQKYFLQKSNALLKKMH